MVKRVVFIGAGNVASHLAPAIQESGAGKVVQIYSRTADSAEALAGKVGCSDIATHPSEVIADADVYIVSLVDDAVAKIAEQLPRNNALWLHTSGSLPMEVLSDLSPNYGVYYPLQTFSRSVSLDLSDVPVFIEGCTSEIEAEIRQLASKTFKKVYKADSELRRKMHVAAVFACNFTNYMWTVADDLLREDNLTLDVLKPLLEETLRKAVTARPADGQTGPAMRGDDRVMSKHMEMLPTDLADIYGTLSQAIYKRHHDK